MSSNKARNLKASNRSSIRSRLGTLGILHKLSSLIGADGYSNVAAFLGDDSTLLSSGSFRRNNLSSNLDQLTTMYRVNWLCKRIIDMPTEDMVRSWYKLSTDISEDDIHDLIRLEAKNNIKQEIADAIRWSRLYGGSIALIVIKDQDDLLDLPLDIDSLSFDCFKGLLVLDRTQGISPSIEIEDNMDDPDFGLPMYYNVSYDLGGHLSTMRIHHSRILRFVGRELPHSEMISESYWGASEMEHIYEELMKRSATSANIAQLLFQANITTLKMSDFGEALALGSDSQKNNILNAIETENRFRSSFGIQLLSSGDSMENLSYSFSGISDIYEQFMMDMAGAAEIPATKLFGRSPQGLNSTGESDLKNYYETIAQMQERHLRPALEKLVPIMAISCWGYCPESIEIVFDPLVTISPKDRAEMVNIGSNMIFRAFELNLISKEEACSELKALGNQYGYWTKLSDTIVKPDDISEDDPISSQEEIIFPDNYRDNE